jgi:hypothetical protein
MITTAFAIFLAIGGMAINRFISQRRKPVTIKTETIVVSSITLMSPFWLPEPGEKSPLSPDNYYGNFLILTITHFMMLF